MILDEVITGFGITGDWFSCIKSQVTPDTVCLSKSITGGFSPLSVTICSGKIYDTFYSDYPINTFYLIPENLLYIMPPYCIIDEELCEVSDGIYEIFKAI